MQKISLQNLKQISVRNFNICFFISLCILTLYPDSSLTLQQSGQGLWFPFLIIPIYNGLLTSLITIFLNRYFSKRNFTQRYYVADKKALAIVAFAAGFLGIYIITSSIGTYLVSIIIIYIAILNVKDFINKLASMLTPNTLATTKDLAEFANFFITLVITFSVINLSINTIHNNFRFTQAFNFGDGLSGIIDALYFSVITMTTLGYGDIFPHTVIARIIVAFECLTGYLMFGIMIGIITRGISFTKKD